MGLFVERSGGAEEGGEGFRGLYKVLERCHKGTQRARVSVYVWGGFGVLNLGL